jgi:hypothetical protein
MNATRSATRLAKKLFNAVIVFAVVMIAEIPGILDADVSAAVSSATSYPKSVADSAWQPAEQQGPRDDDLDYAETIRRTANMVWDTQAQALAQKHGLHIVNVTWEDTGRYYNSSVGPNISDMTIQVQQMDPLSEQYQLTLMPVIRYPNFSDMTADISPDQFFLLVGNEKGTDLHKISLREYLGNFRNYLHDQSSWAGRESSLLNERDSYVLVSAQAAFLPVPKRGKAEFNPVLFNYQSYAGDPAVLVIVATREGTSATIIDNTRDAFPAGFSWGQRLFFNQNGERSSFTGERLSDFSIEDHRSSSGDESGENSAQANGESGLNMVLVIQVPLKQKHPLEEKMMMESAPEAASGAVMLEAAESDIEAAVIGHGKVEGPFTEIDGLQIERDERFPIRVTVQFYQATSNGVIDEADMQVIAAQIQRVYQDADYAGSLVVEGSSDRPTEYEGPKQEPPGWWRSFWKRFEENTGLEKAQALDLLRSLKMDAKRWLEPQLKRIPELPW